MKLSILSIGLLFSFSVFAAEQAPRNFPASIKCETKAKSKAAKKFTITQLDSDRPDSSFNDTSPLDSQVYSNHIVSVAFSNECDNSYNLVVFSEDLEALKKGEAKVIKGILQYFDVVDEEVSETVSAVCTVNN